MALTRSAAVLAVVCATALMMTTPAAAQSQQELSRCQTTASNVAQCTLSSNPFDPTAPPAPPTPVCCSLIKDAQSGQMECLCGAYLGMKSVDSQAGISFQSVANECGITTDFSTACAKIQKQLQDAGYLNKGLGNQNAGSGKDTGAAGKTATAGVVGVLLVTALTMLF